MKTSLLARVLSSTAILGIAVSVLSCTAHAAPKTPIPAAAADASLSASSCKQTAVFAGGCFWGTSYRSAIFYTDDEQRRIATAYIAQLDAAKVFPKRIVTEVTPLKRFYRAEDYHQDYALHHPNEAYIQICDRPKISALKEQFPE